MPVQPITQRLESIYIKWLGYPLGPDVQLGEWLETLETITHKKHLCNSLADYMPQPSRVISDDEAQEFIKDVNDEMCEV